MLNLEITKDMLFELISKGLNSTCEINDICDSPNIGTFILKARNLDEQGIQDGNATIKYHQYKNGFITSSIEPIKD